MNKDQLVMAAILGVLFLQIGCKKETSTEPPIEPPPKDPRTYTWTIDTLAYPGSLQTNMSDVWASSSNDIYVVGLCDDLGGIMWHYDGSKWSNVKLWTGLGGPIAGSIQFGALYGQASNNIWAVGERLYQNPTPPPNFNFSSLILHFDGSQWREYTVANGDRLFTIRGIGSSDIWAGGASPTIFHYDGAKWQRDSVPVSVPKDTHFYVSSFTMITADDVYLIGYLEYVYLPNRVYYIYHRQNKQWSVIDSAISQPGLVENKWGIADMWTSPSGTSYSCGGGVFRKTGDTWQQIYSNPNYLARIVGTSDNNIFVVGHISTVLHYNGADWYQFNQFKVGDVVYSGIWTNGREVFIVGAIPELPGKSIILHGR